MVVKEVGAHSFSFLGRAGGVWREAPEEYDDPRSSSEIFLGWSPCIPK